jgi:hypothetical protein
VPIVKPQTTLSAGRCAPSGFRESLFYLPYLSTAVIIAFGGASIASSPNAPYKCRLRDIFLFGRIAFSQPPTPRFSASLSFRSVRPEPCGNSCIYRIPHGIPLTGRDSPCTN